MTKMTSKPEPIIYTSLPPDPNSDPPITTTTTTVNYVVLPIYPRTFHHHLLRRILLSLSLFLLFTLSLFLLFPSNPTLKLSRINLNHIHINSSNLHHLSLDLSLSLTIKVRNPDFFSLNYDSLDVAISYRGKELGFVRSSGGKVNARGSSYVDATLVVDGFQVLHDFFYLIEDVAAGRVPFDTVSNIKGKLGLLFVNIPIQGKVSCEVDVNPRDQMIVHQNCYPE